MAKRPSKPAGDLDALKQRAADCRSCPLWKNATQTVFGEGPPGAALMVVGEQPGDQEDRDGRPFVGPAGQLLDRALEEAGIDRRSVYVTNAVKHFKWTPRGKRRIHERPNREEILACRMWLEEEVRLVRPRAILALGATAAMALFGPTVRVLRDRGTAIESSWAPIASVTAHPSSVLRAPDDRSRREGFARLVADLKAVAARLRRRP